MGLPYGWHSWAKADDQGANVRKAIPSTARTVILFISISFELLERISRIALAS
jgi:hypothetical protein